MSGKRLVFQKKLVKISKPLMGKLLSVATPMVQVKIEPSERPRSDDFEEVAIDGTSSTNDISIASTAPKKHDFVVYMCKICKMYFPVRQMLESHNAKVHAPQKKSPAISRVVDKVINQSTKIDVSLPKKRQKRLQLSALMPPESESPAEDQDRIYFTGYYKNSTGYYVCNSCDFSSRIRSTVASHATRKHNSCGLGNEEKPTPLSADTAEDCTKVELIEDDEDSWPVEVIEEKQEEEEEEENNEELNQIDPLVDKQERSCPYCPFVSNIRSTYHSHVKRKHREQWLKSVAKRVADLRTTSSFATNTADNQLTCTACPFKSFKRSTMRSHFSRKHEITDSLNDDPDFADMQAQTEGKKVRKCPYCPFESWIYSTMNSHIMRNHGNQPHPLSSKSKPRYNTQLYTGYACHYCTFAGATVMSIRSHTAREHTGRKQPLQQVPVQEFDCDQCDYKTKSRRNMQLHLKDCHTMLANSEGMFQCHACSYETLSRMGLQRHVSIKHSMLGNTNISESAYFRCDHCDYKTLNSKLMDWHKRQHSEDENDGENDGNSYECNDCDFSTWTKAQLYQHIRRKHKDGEGNEKKEPELESDQLYACGQCDYVSKNKHAMKTHVLRKHTDDYPHECNLCEKKYKVKADLTNHIRFQHREQPIMCDVCGKTCRNSNLLYLHQKFAHYKPDFECHICHRRMVSQANLDEHILKQHEQVEESVCEECGKTFRKAARLKIHMRVHTGLKPYTCKICMKSFARRNGLRQHLLIHTGVRPYICDICGKSFTQKTGLICHRKMHPGDKPPLPRVTIDHVLTDLL